MNNKTLFILIAVVLLGLLSVVFIEASYEFPNEEPFQYELRFPYQVGTDTDQIIGTR